LPHHDDYDTKRRQTKDLTISEAKTARDRLYAFIETGGDLATTSSEIFATRQLERSQFLIDVTRFSMPRAPFYSVFSKTQMWLMKKYTHSSVKPAIRYFCLTMILLHTSMIEKRGRSVSHLFHRPWTHRKWLNDGRN
jgi:hypothetical protein